MTANMPAAEVDVDDDLVQRLVADQHPDLAGLPVSLVAHGWDTVVFRLGEDLVVRLPRRQLAADFFAREQVWLGTIAPRLPVPVPVTMRFGRPQGPFPWTWSVCPWIPGRTADVAVARASAGLAGDVAAFLHALHRPAPADAPRNPFRGVPLADRAERFAEHLAVLDGDVDRSALERRWEAALAVPVHAAPPVWIHGDLHPQNVLVYDGRLSGVIDFIDVAAGDPATDLAIAWMLFDDPEHRRRLRNEAAAGGVDDATWARAEGWALALAVAILAGSADNPVMASIARATLGRLAPN